MATETTAPEIRAFWQPGCTSCLRMKEFLQRHGVPFTSVNVLEEKGAMEELLALGYRTVPIIRRGNESANGQVLRDLQDPTGKLPETSGATERDGVLYVQSLHADAFGVLPLKAAGVTPRSP